MSLKQILARSTPLLGAVVLAFVLGFATAWIAMQTVATDIRAEMRCELVRLRGEMDAVRTRDAALGGDAQSRIADLDRRVTLIERHLGLSPIVLPRSAATADREHRPPLPPRLPPRRSSTGR